MTPETVKTIGILIPTLLRGGAEKQAALLAASLRPYYRVYLIVLCPLHDFDPDIVRLSTLHDDEIIRMTGNPVERLSRLRKFLQSHAVDTLFCYLTRADLVGPVIGRRAGVSRIYQGVRNSALPLWKRWLERVGSAGADGIVFNSNAGMRNLSYLSDGRAVVIHNCLDDTPVSAVRWSSIPAGKVIVVTSSRFVSDKDYATAVEAMRMAMTPEGDPERRMHWLILGHGPLRRKIARMISRARISERVTLLDTTGDSRNLMAGSDIYFSASRLEGMPNSVMEAMASGLPVVATDTGDSRELVGEGGFVSPVGDYKSLASSLSRLAYNPELRNRMGSSGRERVYSMYNRERFVASYLKLLNQGISSTRGTV